MLLAGKQESQLFLRQMIFRLSSMEAAPWSITWPLHSETRMLPFDSPYFCRYFKCSRDRLKSIIDCFHS